MTSVCPPVPKDLAKACLFTEALKKQKSEKPWAGSSKVYSWQRKKISSNNREFIVSNGKSDIWLGYYEKITSWLVMYYEKNNICLGGCYKPGAEPEGPQ